MVSEQLRQWDIARGSAVILLDADLQHPPELIPAMLAEQDAGFDVIDGIKSASDARETEFSIYHLAARAFYGLIGGNTGAGLQSSSDFKLLDRQVVDTVKDLPERHRFFRGLVAWVGFRVARVPFRVRDRIAGTSKWSIAQLFRYAVRCCSMAYSGRRHSGISGAVARSQDSRP